MRDFRNRTSAAMVASVAVLAMAVVGVLLHTMVVGGRITGLWIPQVEAMTQIQLHATRADLWIEESLAGDRSVDLDQVWTELDEARRLGSTLLGENATEPGPLRPLTDEAALAATERMIALLDEFRVLSEARVAARGGAEAGSRIDLEVDDIFGEFNQAALEARSDLQQRYAADLQRFRLQQRGMIGFVILLAVGVALGFLRLHARMKRALSTAQRWSGELEQIYNTTSISMTVFDEDLHFIRVNKQAAAMNDLPLWEHPGRFVKDVVPWFPDELVELYRQVLRSGIPILNREVRMPTPSDPDTTWNLLVNITPVEIAEASAPCLLVTAQDLTSLRVAEAALRETTARFESFMQQLPACAFLKDDDLRTLWVNDEMNHMFGARDWIGRTADELFPGGPGLSMMDADRRALAEGGVAVEETVSVASGEHRRFQTIKFPIPRDEGPPFLGGIAIDITSLREAEEALRASEEKLRTIVENSTNMFYSHTTDHRITYVSPQVREILDAEPEEAMVRWTEFATENPINDEGMAITQRAIDTGEPQPTYELELRTLTGRRVFVEVREAPVVVDGKTTAIVGALTDITERRELAEQLLQSQKLEAVGRLAGGVAHDFNNILQAVFSQVALLRSRLPSDAEARPLLMGLQASADRASDLTRQLLAFSRRQVLKFETVDLSLLFGSTLEMLQRMVGEEVEIRFTAPADLWTVQADPNQMQQVLTNLIVNARDAMGARGQIFIRAENRPGHGGGDDQVVFEVADDGIGMDEVTLEHIFEPFFTTKEQGKGTGLGLSTVYGIVQQHRGRIEVDSQVLHGSTFRVWLPRFDQDPSGSRADEAAVEALPSGCETLLLAEDEDEVRKLTCEVLSEAGYRVISASDGVEAMELFDEDPARVDLAVLDVVMPRAGGSDVARHLREVRPELQILFTSGYSEEFIEGRHAVDGDVELIQKPYRLTTLLTTIRRLLEEGR
jgi:PAS domain S-box-containing protein